MSQRSLDKVNEKIQNWLKMKMHLLSDTRAGKEPKAKAYFKHYVKALHY